MQMQADYMGAEVTRPVAIETTAMGAAYLAGLGIGFWKSLDEIKKIWQTDRVFKVQISPSVRKARLQLWHQAVKRSRIS